MLGWLRERTKAALQEERRLHVGKPSQPGDYIECQICHQRWTFDLARPGETSFEHRFLEYVAHMRLEHPEGC